MRLRYAVTVLAGSIILSSGLVNAEMPSAGTMLRSDGQQALQDHGTLVAAETEKKKTDPAPSPDVEERGIRPGLGGIAPGRGTFTPVPFKCETDFPSGQNVCLCKGTADCFDMGSKDVCKTGTIDCPAGQGHCTCMKKQ
jgi:hypothetical protein